VPETARWFWLEGSPERLNLPRAYAEPGRDRTLYRVAGGRLESCEYLYVACPGCGTLHARCDDHGHRLKECTLCRTSLSKTRV
jgi:hypothetical protein